MKTQPVISGLEDGRQPHTINVGSIKKLGRSRKKFFFGAFRKEFCIGDNLSFSPVRPIFDFRVSAL